VRGLLAATLEQGGHGVVAVADAQDALREIGRSGIDLIVLDLHLPGMSGVELLRRLRADQATARTPIVLMSGEFDGRSDGYATAYGADATLPKPFEPDELLGTVNRLLAARANAAP
jgi:DNA-binding response OmpR family regulator